MANVVQNVRLIILLPSISGIVKAVVIPFANVNTNTQYACYMRHKHASANKWISKRMKKIQLEVLKITCEGVYVQ